MRKKVLIVEDDRELRDLYEEIFQELETVFAISGEDGWQKFQESRPSLVITDLKMETSDAGLVLARRIKRVSATPVIMVSATAEEKSDCVDFLLSKPFDINILKSAVEKFLERR